MRNELSSNPHKMTLHLIDWFPVLNLSFFMLIPSFIHFLIFICFAIPVIWLLKVKLQKSLWKIYWSSLDSWVKLKSRPITKEQELALLLFLCSEFACSLSFSLAVFLLSFSKPCCRLFLCLSNLYCATALDVFSVCVWSISEAGFSFSCLWGCTHRTYCSVLNRIKTEPCRSGLTEKTQMLHLLNALNVL